MQKARKFSILTASECELGGRGHGVALVEDDELDASAHQLLSAAEALDLVSDDVDAAVITGIELEGHVLVVFRTVDFLGDGQHAGCLACTRRPIEEQVRHVLRLNELAN